ncbi:MAG TPA: ferric reductase-like transmembrane domain-containing protein [Bdellovibrionales bacterium]|nr:ferric reductase-like transmembrane domain-containing protein [Bdellovibrionales bacterium]
MFETIFAATLLFSIYKYCIAGDVPAADIPLFVANKAIAWTGTIMIAACLTIGPLKRLGFERAKKWMRLRKNISLVGAGAIFVHVLITMIILNAAYYPKLFDTKSLKLTGLAQASLLAAALATLILALLALTSVNPIRRSMGMGLWKSVHGYGLVLLGLTLAHLAFLGWPSWSAPAKWPALWLPPITLLAALPIGLALGLRILAGFELTRRERAAETS